MTKQYVEIELSSLAHDGRAVGRMDVSQSHDALNRQVVFVQGGLPGQRVLVQLSKLKKNFAEGICIEVLRQADDVITPPCMHAHECGGCPLQAMPYEKQLFWKQNMLMEALQRIGKLQHIPFTKIYPSPLLWGYRNKMEFAVGKDKHGLILGQRGKASHDVMATPHCLLMPKQCTAILHNLLELMNATELEPWTFETQDNQSMQGRGARIGQGIWRHVVLRMPHNANKLSHVQIITAPADAQTKASIAKLGQTLLDAGLGVMGFVHEERKSTTLYAQGERCITQLGQKYLYENLAGVQYKLSHNSFFQVNTQAAELLCAEAKNMAALTGSEIVWDIYCGVGAPSLGFAQNAKALYGVELNAKAIAMAKENASNLNFTHCHYLAEKAENIIKQASRPSKHTKATWPKPDVLIVDPPRAGLHINVLQGILNAKPKRVVYISCNPSTFARDVALLSKDYELKSLSAVDLFPHTAHVESCALLSSRH